MTQTCNHIWEADETGVRCCALCGVTDEQDVILFGTQTCDVCETKFLRFDGKCPVCFPPTTNVFGQPL